MSKERETLLCWAFSLAPTDERTRIHWVHGFLTGWFKAGKLTYTEYQEVSHAVATVAIEH